MNGSSHIFQLLHLLPGLMHRLCACQIPSINGQTPHETIKTNRMLFAITVNVPIFVFITVYYLRQQSTSTAAT